MEEVGRTLKLMGEALLEAALPADPDMAKFKSALARLLVLVKRGEYGPELFNALARLTVTPAAEACCFRYNSQVGYEVLLRRRGPQEAYPGQFHCPGTVYRPGESDRDLFSRLERTESMLGIQNPRLVGHNNHLDEERGHFMALIFLVDAEAGKDCAWYPVNSLPEPMVEHHRTMVIPIALTAFKQDRVRFESGSW